MHKNNYNIGINDQMILSPQLCAGVSYVAYSLR